MYGAFFSTKGNVKSPDSKLKVDINVTVHHNSFVLLSCAKMSVESKIFFSTVPFSICIFLWNYSAKAACGKNMIRKRLKKIIQIFVWMNAKNFCEDKRDGCFQYPTCLFSTVLSLHTLLSLCFSLSYSAYHRCAWRQSDVFSVCSFTCTCQRSWMSHLNWQQMVLFGYVRPDLSVQPTLHAIYHHSPSLSSPPRPLKGL